MQFSEVLSLQLPASSSDIIYVLPASSPKSAILSEPFDLEDWSLEVMRSVSHVYLLPTPSASPFHLPPPLGARILKETTATTPESSNEEVVPHLERLQVKLYLWGTEAVELEQLDKLAFEVRNDSYFVDECALLTAGSSSTLESLTRTPLVANGCAVDAGVRILHPLSRLDPQCRKESATATLGDVAPPTDAEHLCSTCHPHLCLVIERQFLKSHLLSNLTTRHRSKHLVSARIQCTLIGFKDAPLISSGNAFSEESVALKRTLQNLGPNICNVCLCLIILSDYSVIVYNICIFCACALNFFEIAFH